MDAARGMGMTGPGDPAGKVEIPVALPLIVRRPAGSRRCRSSPPPRIAADVGLGGLGRYIIDGLATRNYGEVAGGALLVVIMALLVEVVFVGLRYLVVPAPLRAQARAS